MKGRQYAPSGTEADYAAMGIKFHCPQGHKLNVKAFLAGKKGVCPKCGTKLRIPQASEPGLGDADDSDAGKALAGHPGNGAAVKTPVATAAAAPVMPAAFAMPAARPAVSGPLPAAMTATQVAAPAMPAMPAAMPAPAISDPIAEAPGAIWYVRPPSGGQFGPARGDVMRKWIAEGRVSSDSLIWREGWTDWQTAGKLFPNLQSVSGGAATAAPAPTGVTRAARTVSRYQAKKSGGNSTAIALLIFLAIVCVALVAVLLVVLFNQT
jgi:hypothetical protein